MFHAELNLDLDAARPQFRGFSLQEEGANTNRYALRNPNVKLRHQGIAFVSAGTTQPGTEDEEEDGPATPQEAADTLAVEEKDDTDVDTSDGPTVQHNSPMLAEPEAHQPSQRLSNEAESTRNAKALAAKFLQATETSQRSEIRREARELGIWHAFQRRIQVLRAAKSTSRPSPTQRNGPDIDISAGAMAQLHIHSTVETTGHDTDETSSDIDMIGTDNNLAASSGNGYAGPAFQTSPPPSALPAPKFSSGPAEASPSPDAQLFFIDTTGDPTVKANGKRPIVREPSPARSDSSGEVVFGGRNNPTTISDPPQPQPQKLPPHRRAAEEARARSEPPAKSNATPVLQVMQQVDSSPEITDALLAVLEASNPEPPPTASKQPRVPTRESSPAERTGRSATGWASQPSKFDTSQQPSSNWSAAPEGSWWKKRHQHHYNTPRPDLDPSAEELEAFESAGAKKTRVQFVEPKKGDMDVTEAIRQPQQNPTSQLSNKRALKRPQERQSTPDGLKSANRPVSHHLGVQMQRSAGRPIDGAEEDEKEDLVEGIMDEILSCTKNRRGKRGRKRQNRQLAQALDESDAAEDQAYEDYMENLLASAERDDDADMNGGDEGQLFSKLAGPSLMVDDNEIGEDELLNPNLQVLRESSTDSTGPIGQDFSDVYSTSDSDDRASDLDSSDLEDELEYTEKEQWEDEVDLRQRRQNAMTDEQLARLYAKQEQFGYGGDELIIDDGAYLSISEGFGDVDAARAGLAEVTRSAGRGANKHGMRRRSGKRSGTSFPDASLLADVVEQDPYGGFDIMDFDRPSLKPKAKGRKGKLPPELEGVSDDELREEMVSAWDNDREKKRLKKAEREELRMQGLLGSAGRKGKADLGMKYQEGMTMLQVKAEVRAFVTSDQLERKFPPMGKDDRKALHEICNALGLKSKSMGGGKARFPIIYKTSRTPDFDDDAFNNVMFRASRGFLKNSARAGKANKFKDKPVKSRAGRGGGFSKAATSYRDGDVVGNGAAELGKENFGHKLMEKMGWTKGMALGKDGDGLLVPVAHVVKMGKGGLG